MVRYIKIYTYIYKVLANIYSVVCYYFLAYGIHHFTVLTKREDEISACVMCCHESTVASCILTQSYSTLLSWEILPLKDPGTQSISLSGQGKQEAGKLGSEASHFVFPGYVANERIIW